MQENNYSESAIVPSTYNQWLSFYVGYTQP